MPEDMAARLAVVRARPRSVGRRAAEPPAEAAAAANAAAHDGGYGGGGYGGGGYGVPAAGRAESSSTLWREEQMAPTDALAAAPRGAAAATTTTTTGSGGGSEGAPAGRRSAGAGGAGGAGARSCPACGKSFSADVYDKVQTDRARRGAFIVNGSKGGGAERARRATAGDCAPRGAQRVLLARAARGIR